MKDRTSYLKRDWFDVLPYVLAGAVILFMILPILVIIPMSFSEVEYFEFPPRSFSLQWYINFFTDREWRSAMFLSLQVALITMFLSAILGTLASFGLVRGNFRGKGLIQVMVISPLIIPLIIIALASYFFYARLHLIGTKFALITAHTVLAVPYVIITLSATLRGFDKSLEMAAKGLGANWFQTFFRVTLPVIRPGIISGAILAFMKSFDEVLTALYILGTSAITLPKKMWDGMERDIDPTITAVASLLVSTTIFLMILFRIVGRSNAAVKGGQKRERIS